MSPDLVSPPDPAYRQRRLLLCYVSGLDLRRVDRASTPFLLNSLAAYPWARLKNLPSNELFSTLVTGVSPVEHGVWGVRQRSVVAQTRCARAWSMSPDLLTTTIQGAVHLATGVYDLAAIPPWRRRHFEITRPSTSAAVGDARRYSRSAACRRCSTSSAAGRAATSSPAARVRAALRWRGWARVSRRSSYSSSTPSTATSNGTGRGTGHRHAWPGQYRQCACRTGCPVATDTPCLRNRKVRLSNSSTLGTP